MIARNHNTLARIALALLLLSVFAVAGCSSKGKGSASGAYGEGTLGEQDLDRAHEGRYGSGSIPLAEEGGIFRDIHFPFDSTEINDVARQNIDYNVQVLRSNPEVRLQLEGHCDERGTAEYNLALGERRARAVYEVLMSYGLPASRLQTISYGEEVPVDAGNHEHAWSKNRRVHFSAFRNLPG